MKIIQMTLGMVQTNCYIVYDETTMHGAVIDPADHGDKILAEIEKAGITLDYILLTHGHFDHILAVPYLREKTDAKLVMHPGDARLLDPATMGSYRNMARGFTKQTPDILAEGGTQIAIGNLQATYLHTPGHTPGSCCVQVENVLFSGDTLFRYNCGRCDLEGGSYPIMLKSLARLAGIRANLHVLPGHEGASTLDEERRGNPYMKEALQS